jgi:hypothetical protein
MTAFETYKDRTLVQMKILANQQNAEIERLRDALRPFAGMPENGEAETAVPNDSPVTIRCQLGDVRRAFKALANS